MAADESIKSSEILRSREEVLAWATDLLSGSNWKKMKNKLAEKCSNKYKQTYKFHRLCFDEWKKQVGSQIMAEFYPVQKANNYSAIFFLEILLIMKEQTSKL